jgi:Mg-chelatase subunit ChlD
MKRIFAFLVLASLAFDSHDATAQPALNLSRVVSNWPTIELYFTASCNGTPTVITDKQYLSVTEGGRAISSFDVWCPDLTQRCAMSVALAFDASGSMLGAGNAGAKRAGHAFVDLMDGTVDQAAVIWFNTTTTLDQSFTTSKAQLHQSIDRLPATGGTQLWDALYASVQEVAANQSNPCRAVVALSDGADGSSSRAASEVISLANRNRIPVHCIAFGISADTTTMSLVSKQTGGRFFATTDTARLIDIYREIATSISGNLYTECLITYQAACTDGSMRSVKLALNSFCGGSDAKSKSYKAPRDTTAFSPVRLGIGSAGIAAGEDVQIPLTLFTNIDGHVFPSAYFRLRYDTSRVKLKHVMGDMTDILELGQFSIFPNAAGADVFSYSTRTVQPGAYPRSVCQLIFSTSPLAADSLRIPIRLSSVQLESGCLLPACTDGSVLLTKSRVHLSCAMEPPALQLAWDSVRSDYASNPFPVRMRVSNAGSEPARTGLYHIVFDRDIFELVSPTVDTYPGTPIEVMPGSSSTVQWMLRAKRRNSDIVSRISITGSYDNHSNVECFTDVSVSAAPPELQCELHVQPVRFDTTAHAYDPMPFRVDAVVRNLSGKQTDSVFVRLLVPPPLKIGGPNGYGMDTEHLLPVRLDSAGTGTMSWVVWHPISISGRDYVINLEAGTSEVNLSSCTAPVSIPPIPEGALSIFCNVPDSLTFVDSLGTYVPAPFSVSVSCLNRGIDTLYSSTALVMLPVGARTVPGEKLVKPFAPQDLPIHTGGPVPGIEWKVQYDRKVYSETFLEFRFRVSGRLKSGETFDTIVTCRVRIPAAQKLWCCDLVMPDSLTRNGSGTDVSPNPFPVRYRIWNCGTANRLITSLRIGAMTGDSLSVDPSTPQVMQVNRMLSPGDTLTADWLMRVRNRTSARRVSIAVYAFDEEQRSITIDPPCAGSVDIPATTVVGIERPAVPGVMRLEQNTPNPFSRSTVIPFRLSEASTVTIDVYNLLGVHVARLVEGPYSAGTHEVAWNATDDLGRVVPRGLYMYRLNARNAAGKTSTASRAMVRRW